MFADWDNDGPATTEEKLAEVRALNPSTIVYTSAGKFHAYWKTTGIPIGQFKPIQQAIARKLGTDPAVCNPARIMRVPGFSHVKDPTDPQPVTLELFQDAPVLTLADIASRFGPITQDEKPASTGTVRPAGAIDPKLLAEIKAALPFIPNSEYDIWLQVGMALEFEGAPIELWKEWSSSDSSYDEAVCDSKWETFSRADGEVVTAKTIFHLAQENGWTNDGHWAQPELNQAQDRLLAAIAALDTKLTQSDDTKRMALARADADFHEAAGVLDDQRQRRQLGKNDHEMKVRGLKAQRGAAQRQAENDRLAAVRVIHNEGLKLLDDHAAALVAIKRQSSTAFSAIQARLLVVTGLGKRDLDRAIRQAEVQQREQANQQEAMQTYLAGYAYLTADNMVADLATGISYGIPAFNKMADQTFPGLWEPGAHADVMLARWGNAILAQDSYCPGQPRIVEKESVVGTLERMLNVYNAPVLPVPVFDAAHAEMLIDHIYYVSGRDSVFAEYLLDFMAFIIQRQGERINSAPVIIGPKGNGKSFLADLMTACLGKSNVCVVTTQELAGQFQDDLAFKQLRFVEEIKVQENQTSLMETLKPWITNSRVPCNRKNRAKITVDNVGNWMFFSNHEDALRIEADERRYAVAISRELPMPQEYYQRLFGTFIPSSGGSVASVLHLLMNRDLSGFNPCAHAPHTAARDEMLENLLSSDGRVMARWASNPPADMDGIELMTFTDWQMTVERLCDQEVGEFGRTRTANKGRSNNNLNKLAKDAGLVALGQKRITAGSRVQTRVFALRNADQWRAASNEAIAEQFEHQRNRSKPKR